ncbi:hypothetical protein GE09DRAFT_356554 [Coniochaeta sp. 2T2.1]|nr:hypothetical protein GE09DRAFT_356554 [Coniochaeta sp. 2T2.1]
MELPQPCGSQCWAITMFSLFHASIPPAATLLLLPLVRPGHLARPVSHILTILVVLIHLFSGIICLLALCACLASGLAGGPAGAVVAGDCMPAPGTAGSLSAGGGCWTVNRGRRVGSGCRPDGSGSRRLGSGSRGAARRSLICRFNHSASEGLCRYTAANPYTRDAGVATQAMTSYRPRGTCEDVQLSLPSGHPCRRSRPGKDANGP